MSEPQQHPAQPYGSPPPQQPYPGQQYSAPAPAPAPATSTGSLGRVAFIVGLVTLGIELLRILSFPFILRGVYDAASIGVVTSIGSGLVLIAAVAALVLGLIAVRRSDRTILAGIAVGIGASALADIVISWLSNMLYTVAYL